MIKVDKVRQANAEWTRRARYTVLYLLGGLLMVVVCSLLCKRLWLNLEYLIKPPTTASSTPLHHPTTTMQHWVITMQNAFKAIRGGLDRERMNRVKVLSSGR